MSDTKTMVRFFSVPQWEREQEFLREQHRRGWALTQVTGLGVYHFRRCQPEEVVYQLDYNPDCQTSREEYLQIFRDCGWEYLQDYMGYSYFRKAASAMQGQEGIFSDVQSRLDMIHRVFVGRMLPLLLIFICLVPVAVWYWGTGHWVIGGIYAVLLALYVGMFISFGSAFRRMQKKWTDG